MAGVRTERMSTALGLVSAGMPVRMAARITGCYFTSVYQALKVQRGEAPKPKPEVTGTAGPGYFIKVHPGFIPRK